MKKLKLLSGYSSEGQELKDALKFYGGHTAHIEVYWHKGTKEQVSFNRPSYSTHLDHLMKGKFYDLTDRSSVKAKVRSLQNNSIFFTEFLKHE